MAMSGALPNRLFCPIVTLQRVCPNFGVNVAHLRATSVSEWGDHSLTLVALTKLTPILVRTPLQPSW
jgi:hypothetical protein